jgi:hypothetical protein
MANNNFVVQNGLTVGPLTIDAATGSITTTGNITSTSAIANESVNTLSANVITAGSSSGNISITGNLLPSANVTYSLGSRTSMWKDVFVGPGTLYINGKAVISDNSGTITFTTDVNQNLSIQTSGTGDLQLNPTGTGAIALQNTVRVTGGKTVTTSDSSALLVAVPLNTDSISSRSSNTNLSLSAQGTGKIAINNQVTGGGTVNFADTTASTSTGTGAVVIQGGLGVGKDLYVNGNVYSYGVLAVQTSQLSVNAPLVYLAASPSYPYSYEIGMYSHFIGGAANAYSHTGVVRDHNDSTWKFFANCTSEPTTTVNWSDPNLYYDKVKTGDLIIANTTVSTSTTTGALQVAGGAGVSGALYVGGAINATGSITGTLATASQPNITTLAGVTSIGASSSTTLTGTLQTGSQTNITAVGTLSGLTVSAAIAPSTNNTINLGGASNYWATIYGTSFVGVSTTAKYADLAENYQADKAYAPGTVVMFGGDKEVTAADADTTAIAGVVSTNPAHLMNGSLTGPNVVPLALQGRVPCMVIGPVKKGDLMVSAGFGYAKTSADPKIGQVIGKALQEVTFAGKAVIEVVVGRV